MSKRNAFGVLIALALASCGGDSAPSPPVKRVSIDDVVNAASRLFDKPKPKPAPQPPQSEPAPAVVPLPLPAPPAAAPPVYRPPPPAVAKPTPMPKPKPQWQKKKAKPSPVTGIAGYSCATVRMAGSAANVEKMATARGHVVTPAVRRQIQACFNQG